MSDKRPELIGAPEGNPSHKLRQARASLSDISIVSGRRQWRHEWLLYTKDRYKRRTWEPYSE